MALYFKKKFNLSMDRVNVGAEEVTPSFIYFPLIDNNGKELKLSVKMDSLVKVGTTLARDDNDFPYYCSISGKVVGIKKMYNYQLQRHIDHLIIENDFKNTKVIRRKIVVDNSDAKNSYIEAIRKSGIIGFGGKNSPVYNKFECKNAHTVLVNATDCEPLLNIDTFNLVYFKDSFIEGCKVAMASSNAENITIAVCKQNKLAYNTLKSLTKTFNFITIKTVNNIYPIGYDRKLIKTIFNKTYINDPTELRIITFNSSTVVKLGQIFTNNEVYTNRVIEIIGDGVKENKFLKVPLYTPIKDIINLCGGYKYSSNLIICGGPMRGKSQIKDDFVTLRETNALCIFKYSKVSEDSCMHCGECSKRCPCSLQPVEIKKALKTKNIERLKELHANDCIECGLCSAVCPSRIKLTESMSKAKMQLRIDKALHEN